MEFIDLAARSPMSAMMVYESKAISAISRPNPSFAKEGTTLAELTGVAGLRWTIETCCETAKDELGLDRCEARSWHARHRHTCLVMAALAFLAELRADLLGTSLREVSRAKANETSPTSPALAF